MVQRLACALAVSMLAFAGSNALAASSASASVTNVQWQLVDLAPEDGVAPSITWISPYSRRFLSATAKQGADKQQATVSAGQYQWFNQTSASATRPGVSASATLFSDHFSAEGSAYRISSTVTRNDYASFIAAASPVYDMQSWEFLLSPNTRLTVSGEVKLEARTSIGSGFSQDFFIVGEWATARFSMSIFNPVDYFNGHVATGFEASAYGPYDWNSLTGHWMFFGGEHTALSKSFSLSYENTTSAAAVTGMDFSVNVQGYSPFASPVPEPSTGAFALIGLCAISLAARRGRSTRQFIAEGEAA